MVFTKNKLFFRIIRFILEPWPDIEALKKEYSAIYLLSYDKKDLPDFSVKEKDTPIIYLNRTMDEIFKYFNHTARNEIRKTFDNKIPGLRFFSDDHDLVANYNLSAEFEKSQGRRPDNISDYRGCKIFSAYYYDELIANIICFDVGSILRAKAICSKRLKVDQPDKRRIISYAGRRLMYEVCQYGLKNNYSIYDLGSVNFAKKNLAQYKMSFTPVTIKEYTYTYRSKWFNRLEKIRQSIKLV